MKWRIGNILLVNGTPMRLVEQIIGVTWRAKEVFGYDERIVNVAGCREMRLHGVCSI